LQSLSIKSGLDYYLCQKNSIGPSWLHPISNRLGWVGIDQCYIPLFELNHTELGYFINWQRLSILRHVLTTRRRRDPENTKCTHFTSWHFWEGKITQSETCPGLEYLVSRCRCKDGSIRLPTRGELVELKKDFLKYLD
jgi:hypothetical protein